MAARPPAWHDRDRGTTFEFLPTTTLEKTANINVSHNKCYVKSNLRDACRLEGSGAPPVLLAWRQGRQLGMIGTEVRHLNSSQLRH
ncbi:hypothetical protein CBM2589_U40005 [Cupriavidus taiwanensis]|uniref:Uncharacterized protein n=1 Tax=Cupriavidus taiwanensis TaxID=164546 RepID=A0A375CRV2_9BURK|nr:hypothetical protein CBM2589_U40005 [Cupriavidus taiwanensis]